MGVFKFSLSERVRLVTSNENGVVIGRSEYTNSPPQYYVRYAAADGRQTECWWSGDALISIEGEVRAA